jgi:hypothetical protein
VLEALDGLEPEIFGEVVAQTEATALRYQQYRDEWIKAMEDREFRSGGSTAKKVADELAGWMVMSVLDFVAEKEQGRGWAQVLGDARTTEAYGLIRKTISGSPTEVLEGARRFFDACACHLQERGSGRDARPKSQVRLLLDRLGQGRCPKSCRRCRS